MYSSVRLDLPGGFGGLLPFARLHTQVKNVCDAVKQAAVKTAWLVFVFCCVVLGVGDYEVVLPNSSKESCVSTPYIGGGGIMSNLEERYSQNRS